MIEIDVVYLRECFDYDPVSGALTWRQRPQRHFPKAKDHRIFNAQFAGKVAGFTSHKGYVVVRILGRQWSAHRIAWAIVHGRHPEDMIDHINGDKADNRIANLREASCSQNQWNCPAGRRNTSGYKGVHKRGKRWRAAIRVNGKYHSLGDHDTAEEAAAAYQAAAIQHHGEFACLSARNNHAQ